MKITHNIRNPVIIQYRRLEIPLIRRSVLGHDWIEPILQGLSFVVVYAEERDDIGYLPFREVVPDQEQTGLPLW